MVRQAHHEALLLAGLGQLRWGKKKSPTPDFVPSSAAAAAPYRAPRVVAGAEARVAQPTFSHCCRSCRAFLERGTSVLDRDLDRGGGLNSDAFAAAGEAE